MRIQTAKLSLQLIFCLVFLLAMNYVFGQRVVSTVQANKDWILIGRTISPVAGAEAIVDKQWVYLFGTQSNSASNFQIDSSEIAPDGSLKGWTSSKMELPNLSRYSIVVSSTYGSTADHAVYLVGGFDGRFRHGDVWYSLLKNGQTTPWTKIADYPNDILLHGSAMVQNHLYVIGGMRFDAAKNDYIPVSEVRFLDVINGQTTGVWTKTVELPEPISRMAVTTYKDEYIYVVGGFSSTQAQSTVYVAKVQSNGEIDGWRALNSLPKALYSHKMIIQDKALVAIGGLSKDNKESDQVIEAGILADGNIGTWSTTTPLRQPVFRHAVATIVTPQQLHAYLIGGTHENSNVFNIYLRSVDHPILEKFDFTSAVQLGTTPIEVTYKIEFSLRDDPYNYQVSNFMLSNLIPTGVILDQSSFQSSLSSTPTSFGTSHQKLVWTLNNLAGGSSNYVSYTIKVTCTTHPCLVDNQGAELTFDYQGSKQAFRSKSLQNTIP